MLFFINFVYLFMTQTLILKIEYNGSRYAGWQRQKNAVSVQSEIEKALFIISGQTLNVVGAGRTDAGVHARGQIAHVRLENPLTIPSEKLCAALNSQLKSDIRIKRAAIVDFEFNSRFDAAAREYSYSLTAADSVFHRDFIAHYKYPFSCDRLIDSADLFLGQHDFTTFSKHNPDTNGTICDVKECRWQIIDDDFSKITICRLKIVADRFIYGMVRSLVGAMLDAARGKICKDDLSLFLSKCDRNLASPLAAANGLILEKIYYPEKFHIFDKND